MANCVYGVKMFSGNITDLADIRNWALVLVNQSESITNINSYEEFLISNNLPDETWAKSTYNELKHVIFMYVMKEAGQWELSWDVFPDADIDLYPIELKIVNAEDYNSFPSLLAELKLFKSGKDAKRSGWAKPITKGDFFFKKKTYILRIK